MFETENSLNKIIYIFLLFLSAAFSYLLIIPYNFPYLSIGIFFIVLFTLIFLFKKERSLYSWILYILTLLFSLFIFYRINPFLTFLNIITSIYLGSILILADKEIEEKQISFLGLLVSPFTILSHLLRIKSSYKFDFFGYLQQTYHSDSNKFYKGFLSLVVTILVLLIIVPLLSYSNPFFGKLVVNFFEIINLRGLIEKLLSENFFIYVARLFLFLVFALVIPRLLTYISTPLKKYRVVELSLPLQNLFLPKIVVGVVLAIFFITQAQLYLASEEILKSLGYSHSQFTREVFAHLSVVTLIVFCLIYNDRSKTYWSKITTYILILEGVFLNFIALKSDYDYIFNWGFTHKRLYGYVTVAWIFGILSLFTYRYFKNSKNSAFIKNSLLYSSLILLAINVVNFDYAIYHFAKSTTNEGIDHYYLSRLSTDAQSYPDHIQKLIFEIETSEKVDFKKVQSAQTLLRKIENLKNKYRSSDLRAFNFSEFFEYQKIKDLNLEHYRNILDSKQFLQALPLGISQLEPQIKRRQGVIDPKIVTPKIINVRLDNLEKRLYNHNFEVKRENNELLLRGSLDTDSFNHTFGPGSFYLVLYEYITKDNKFTETPIKELRYNISEDDVEKVLSIQ